MSEFTIDGLTEAALGRVAGATDPRFRCIMESLVRHLHGFIRDVELTEAEWFEAIRFLTATGQKCDDKRQEYILLSDTLGASMLVDAMAHRKTQGATESTVLGPFHVEGAPELPFGASIVKADMGDPAVISGRVTDIAGRPLAGAALDVWQTAPNGFYDIQDPSQPAYNLRGRFRTGADGRYEFRTLKPVSYSIPTDGPVGKMLLKLSRHAYRPAHIHFIVAAPGHESLTTHLFVEGDPYLDSDAVFGVKNSLVVPFVRNESGAAAAAKGVRAPFYAARYDFGLKPVRR